MSVSSSSTGTSNLPVFRTESPAPAQAHATVDQRHHSHPNIAHQLPLALVNSCQQQSQSRSMSIPMSHSLPMHQSRAPAEMTPNPVGPTASSPSVTTPAPYPTMAWIGPTYVDYSIYSRQEPMPRQVKEWMCCQCGHVVQPVSRHDCGRCLHEFCPYCPRRRHGDPPDRRPSQDIYY